MAADGGLIEMSEAQYPAQSRSPLLMVVDDDEEMREAVALALSGWGFRTVEQANGQAALEYLRHNERPDLILLDLVMPEMDGWEFRGEQLRDAKLADIPVVALSADESAKARAVHAKAFIPKPVSPPALLSTIGEVLGEKSMPQRPAPFLSGADPSASTAWSPTPLARRPSQRSAQPILAAGDLPHEAPQRARLLRRAAYERRLRVQTETQCERQLMLVSGGLSHAINNALPCILAYLESIKVPSSDFDLHAGTLSAVEQCARTIARLTQGAPRTAVRGGASLCESAIWSVVDECRSLCPPHIHLRLTNLQALVDAQVSQQALHDIANELIVNSIEALKSEASVVELRAGKSDFTELDLRGALPTKNVRADTYCYLDVIDRGNGIAPSVLPHIFEPFFSTKFAGRGLGLTIVLARVRQAGGLIMASSEQGASTTFRVILPTR
jgi:CheY-like chemotaxis protein